MSKPHLAILCFAMSACVIAARTHAEPPAIDDTDSVSDIVDTLLNRHGGENATNRWKCGTLSFTTSEGILPPGLGSVTVTESFDFPSFFKRSIIAESPEGKVDLTFIINREGGWMTSPGKPTIEISRSFADRDRHTFADISAVAHLRDNIEHVTVVKKLDIDGRPAIQLRLDSKDLGRADFFVELQSGLLVGTSKQAQDPVSGEQAAISTRLGEYKDIEGIPVPMAFSATSNGRKLLEVAITGVKFEDSLPDSTFAKPE